MSKENIDWNDTELVKRQILSVSVLIIGLWIMFAILILTGFTTTIIGLIVLGALLSLLIVGIFAYVLLTDILKRDPTSVGLSENGIRLRYHDGHHKDISWKDVDGIIYEGSSRPSKIIHKNGSSTPVVVPRRITAEMEKRFQEVRKARKETRSVPVQERDMV